MMRSKIAWSPDRSAFWAIIHGREEGLALLATWEGDARDEGGVVPLRRPSVLLCSVFQKYTGSSASG